mmetsp:Transcript_5231/g.11845  ORF Transcript_5231/g.11845 Transcript_5231/m.11845 type:complete len:106 (+) Transcript_5231:2-319(+)
MEVEGGEEEGEGEPLNDLQQELIEKALVVIRRVMDKLTGLDFAEHSPEGGENNAPTSLRQQQAQRQFSTTHLLALEVSDQVDRLIREATSNENLSQSFFGWCPFW